MTIERRKVRVRLSGVNETIIEEERSGSLCALDSSDFLVESTGSVTESSNFQIESSGYSSSSSSSESQAAACAPHDPVRQYLTGKLAPLYTDLLLSFSSPHCLAVYQCAEEDGHPFIVTEPAPERTLAHYLVEGKGIALEKVCAIFVQVLDALTAAHDAGLVHGALGAGNICIVEDDGGSVYVKVSGIGLRQLCDQSFVARKSDDLRAVGLLLARILTGKMPGEEGAELKLPEITDLPSLATPPSLPTYYAEFVRTRFKNFISALAGACEKSQFASAAYAGKRLSDIWRSYSSPSLSDRFCARIAHLGKPLTKRQERSIIAASLVLGLCTFACHTWQMQVQRQQYLQAIERAKSGAGHWDEVLELARSQGKSERILANILAHSGEQARDLAAEYRDEDNLDANGLEQYQRAYRIYEKLPGYKTEKEELLHAMLALSEAQSISRNSEYFFEGKIASELRELEEASGRDRTVLLEKIVSQVNMGKDKSRFHAQIDEICKYFILERGGRPIDLVTVERLAALTTNPALRIEMNRMMQKGLRQMGMNPLSSTDREKLAQEAMDRGDVAVALLHLRAAVTLNETPALAKKYCVAESRYRSGFDYKQWHASISAIFARSGIFALHQATKPDIGSESNGASRFRANGTLPADWNRWYKLPVAVDVAEPVGTYVFEEKTFYADSPKFNRGDCDSRFMALDLYCAGLYDEAEKYLQFTGRGHTNESAMFTLLSAHEEAGAELLMNSVLRQGRITEACNLARSIVEASVSRVSSDCCAFSPLKQARLCLIQAAMDRGYFTEAYKQCRAWRADARRAVDTRIYGMPRSDSRIGPYDDVFPLE